MVKYSYLFCLFWLLVSCSGKKESDVVSVDLNATVPHIAYSTFVKAVDNLDLHITDSLPINGVERLYVDEGKIFVKDSGREGILIFDEQTGLLIHRVVPFGEAPEEVKSMGAFCLDMYHHLICIFDKGDMAVKMYDYSGRYVTSYATDMFFIDMVKLDEECMTYFYPIYTNGEQYAGIWTADSLNRLKKQQYNRVTEDCKFHYFPMMYNRGDTCVYYYDRNWDEISVVTVDSCSRLYRFDLQQKIPLTLRGRRDIRPQDLDGCSIMQHFAYSDRFVLLSFHTFCKDDMMKENITWMLLDTQTGEQTLSKHLVNDLLPTDTKDSYSALFYKDNHTWIRVDDSEENRIRLQVLHLD